MPGGALWLDLDQRDPVEAAFQVWVRPQPRPKGRKALCVQGCGAERGRPPAQAEEGLWDGHPPAGPQPHSKRPLEAAQRGL